LKTINNVGSTVREQGLLIAGQFAQRRGFDDIELEARATGARPSGARPTARPTHWVRQLEE
jgi:hypothetical protein